MPPKPISLFDRAIVGPASATRSFKKLDPRA
jgi:hypothetical protein